MSEKLTKDGRCPVCSTQIVSEVVCLRVGDHEQHQPGCGHPFGLVHAVMRLSGAFEALRKDGQGLTLSQETMLREQLLKP